LIIGLDTLLLGVLGLSYILGIFVMDFFVDYATLLMALTYFMVALTNMTTIGGISMTTIIGIVAIIWGVLGLVASGGIFRVSRWALYLASVFNIVLIIDVILLLNNPLTQGMIATMSYALLVYLVYIVLPIITEIILIVKREEFI
jgi:hypothetical protein